MTTKSEQEAGMGKAIRQLWWWLRLAVKDFWCQCGWGSMLIEYCDRCGIRQPLVWWSPNDLWAHLTGHADPGPGDHAAGIMCPRCFDELARADGLLLHWSPRLEDVNRGVTPVHTWPRR